MAVRVYINAQTGGTQPYDIYVCQPDNTSCFFMRTINDSDIPYEFDIPVPYDNSSAYLVKLIDNRGCILSGISTT